MIEINGIAHIQLTVNNLQDSMIFYEKVLGFMGMKPVVKAKQGLYMIGGKTAIAITRSDEERRDSPFSQRQAGLHHLCFRAKCREDIDALYEFLVENNVKIVHPPEDGDWAPGYYSLLFEDLEGIRLEINYVPGKGHFESPENLPLTIMPGYENYPT